MQKIEKSRSLPTYVIRKTENYRRELDDAIFRPDAPHAVSCASLLTASIIIIIIIIGIVIVNVRVCEGLSDSRDGRRE